MKKIVVLGIAMLFAVSSFAQNMNVQTAYNHLRKGKLKEALEAIEPALENAQTSGQAKTWFYYGNICFEIANKEELKNVMANPLDEALRGYIKASELDKRKEYKDDITRFIYSISASYYNKGANAYETGKYEEAAENLLKSYNIREQELKIVDTTSLSYAGRSLIAIEKWDRAEEIFSKLRDLNYDDSYIYVALAKIALAKKDINKAAAWLKEGESKYPTDPILLVEKANLYLTTELSELSKDEAVNTLKKIISLEPDNPVLYYNLGICYAADSTKQEEAIEAYKKAVELNPAYTSAYYNLSSMYLEKANEYVKEANALPIEKDKEYNALVDKSKEMLNEALPYVEKAHELDPQDKAVVQILKEIYAKLNMKEKLEALNK